MKTFEECMVPIREHDRLLLKAKQDLLDTFGWKRELFPRMEGTVCYVRRVGQTDLVTTTIDQAISMERAISKGAYRG